jgi:hypothetical protein
MRAFSYLTYIDTTPYPGTVFESVLYHYYPKLALEYCNLLNLATSLQLSADVMALLGIILIALLILFCRLDLDMSQQEDLHTNQRVVPPLGVGALAGCGKGIFSTAPTRLPDRSWTCV